MSFPAITHSNITRMRVIGGKMSNGSETPLSALRGSMRDFKYLPGTNLLDRVESFYDWQQARRKTGLWPLGRSTETGPRATCFARNDDGMMFEGINFASQDYLSLASHDAVRDAAVE